MPRRHVTKSRRQSYSARHHDGGEIARRIVRRAERAQAEQLAARAEQAGPIEAELAEMWGY